MKFTLIRLLVSVLMLVTVEGWGSRRQPFRRNSTSFHPLKRWCCTGTGTCRPSGALTSRSSRGTKSCFQNCLRCMQSCFRVPPGSEVERQAQMCLGYR
uniref:Pancreatic trypsin inhibitor n=1 Tax=Rhipicephalus appendiculatus TaxID=34631 RepID=A0A131YDX9_RHIAP